jgi:hypothetical protein
MQILKPEEFVALAGDDVVSGPILLTMFGFDPEKCQVLVTDKGHLSVTQKGDEALGTRITIVPQCWCYTKDFDAEPG